VYYSPPFPCLTVWSDGGTANTGVTAHGGGGGLVLVSRFVSTTVYADVTERKPRGADLRVAHWSTQILLSLAGRTLGSRTGDHVSGCEVRPCVFTSPQIRYDGWFHSLHDSRRYTIALILSYLISLYMYCTSRHLSIYRTVQSSYKGM
jgi:hypothetical protein